MKTTAEKCVYWFVAANTIVVVITSIVGIFRIYSHYWYDLGYTKATCHGVVAVLLIVLVINGSLLWGIFKREIVFFYPWFLSSFVVVGFLTVFVIRGIFLPITSHNKYLVRGILLSALYIDYVCSTIGVLYLYRAMKKCGQELARDAVHVNKSDLNGEPVPNVSYVSFD